MQSILRTLWMLAVLVWLIVPAISAPPLTITESGYYLTILDVDGVPSFQKIEIVSDLRGGEPVPVDPIPPAIPKVNATLSSSIKALATAVADPATAQGIAAVYAHVRGAYEDGLISDANIWSVLKQATDSSITITKTGKDWTTFRSGLSTIVTEGRQRGTLASKPPILVMLSSVQHGLELSADGSPALSFEQLGAIAIKTNEAIDNGR